MTQIDTVKPERSFKQKVVSAAIWVGLIMFIARSSTAIQSVFVARYFSREDVGILSILILLNAGIEAFTQMGHEAALIQRRSEGLGRAIDTAWISAVVRGACLCACLMLAAPLIADFYEQPLLTQFIRGSALYFLIIGAKSLHIVQYTREMEFSKPKLITVGATISGLLATILVGLLTGSIWCVVVGGIMQRVVEVVLSHVLAKQQVRLRFSREDFWGLFRYGRNIQVVAILVFLVTQMDNAVIGKVISLDSLAVYNYAYILANLPMMQVVGIATQVAFPAWSQVVRAGDLKESNRMFLSTFRLTSLLIIGLSVALFVGGADMIELIFGQKWRMAAPAMRILLLFGVWRGLGANFGALFNSLGRPELITREITLKFLLTMGLLYPLTVGYGIEGTAWAVTIPMCLITPVALWLYMGIAGIDRAELLKTLRWPALFALVSLGAWFGVYPVVTGWTESVWILGLVLPLLSFALCVLPCVIVDPALRHLFKRGRS